MSRERQSDRLEVEHSLVSLRASQPWLEFLFCEVMAKTKAQKKEVIDKLEGAFKTAISTVFVGFTGLTARDETAMRRELREGGVSYTVAKKTLIKRALEGTGHKGETQLDGEVAVAYTKEGDVTAPARLVHSFGKKWAGKLSILGGIFEGKLVGAQEMNEIATIPSMQVLRGMFANVLNAPIAGLAIALSALAQKKGN